MHPNLALQASANHCKPGPKAPLQASSATFTQSRFGPGGQAARRAASPNGRARELARARTLVARRSTGLAASRLVAIASKRQRDKQKLIHPSGSLRELAGTCGRLRERRPEEPNRRTAERLVVLGLFNLGAQIFCHFLFGRCERDLRAFASDALGPRASKVGQFGSQLATRNRPKQLNGLELASSREKRRKRRKGSRYLAMLRASSFGFGFGFDSTRLVCFALVWSALLATASDSHQQLR